MNRKQRAKRSQEQNERDWEKIEPLIRKAVDCVWRNMNEVLQSRFPKNELVNHLWLRDDWISKLATHPISDLLLQMKGHLWQFMGAAIGGSSNYTPEANRRLSDGDSEVAEDVYHNSYRAEPADPADIVADAELLEYLRRKLTEEEKEIIDDFLGKNETLACISKRRRHLRGCSKNMIRAKVNHILVKMRRWAIEQGWSK